MRKRKVSKFYGKEFDNGWRCTGVNIAKCTLSHKTGGPTYWYAFERRTADGKCDKWMRVEAHEATKIWKGLITVEEICVSRETAQCKHMHSINYNFVD